MSNMVLCFLPEKLFQRYEYINDLEKMMEQMDLGLKYYLNAVSINGEISTTLVCGGATYSLDKLIDSKELGGLKEIKDKEKKKEEYKKQILKALNSIIEKNERMPTQKFIAIHSDIF